LVASCCGLLDGREVPEVLDMTRRTARWIWPVVIVLGLLSLASGATKAFVGPALTFQAIKLILAGGVCVGIGVWRLHALRSEDRHHEAQHRL
jgi:hypothetical protein